MRTGAAPPFLTAPPEAVDFSPWRFVDDGQQLTVSVDHWDPGTDLDLIRDCVLDLSAIRREVGLAADAAIAVVPSWRSSSRLAGPGPAKELGRNSGLAKFSVEMRVPGERIAGSIALRCAVILRDPGSVGSALAPRRPGAVLWSDEFETRIEGAAARFPITAAPFSRVPGVPVEAGWFVELNYEDLGVPMLGALRLLLNTERADVMDALTEPSSPLAAPTQMFLQFDVARTLIAAGLDDSEFIERPDAWPEESIGRMLHELFETVWPGESVRAIAERRRHDAGRIDAVIQAHFMGSFG